MKPAPQTHGLAGLELFSDLPASEMAALAAEFETRSLRRGEVLVRQGEEADALYVVVSGRFSVALEGRNSPLCEIGPGQPVGEIAFLAGGTRTATVRAMRDSLVLRLGRDDFERLAAKLPSLWPSLTATLARRLAAANAARPLAPDPRPRTIAVIRGGTGPLPPRFLPLLTSVFSSRARTRIVGSHAAQAILPDGVPLESPEATHAFNGLEAGADFVFFLADAQLTPWSEKAIRQADLVLAVAEHASGWSLNPLECFAAQYLPPEAHRLVLTHSRRGRITGTARWLAQRSIAMHHHVALDGAADVERLYRFINGTALGLVACGGGAFCSAHVGLYQALLESGVTFDIMGGTSAGSAFTAAFALGSAPADIDRATHDIFVTNKAMRRYTWPRYGLLDHSNFDRQLQRWFGGVDIEDLWIPYFAVSTNLSRYDLHLHRRGALWAAVRASSSIPALLPPFYTEDGHMLVDGCLLDNVPIRVMHDLKSGPNVLVSFSLPELECFNVSYDDLPSRHALMWSLLNPLARSRLPAAPGVITVLMRSLAASRQDFTRHMTGDDLLLVPPLPDDAAFLDWHRHSELLQTAYAWGVAEIARLKSEGHPIFAAPPRAPVDAAAE